MKLYIPTTTLNFDNILSSESISPKAFYEKRGFGYKTWETVDENNLENGIVLYKQPFSFTRPDNGFDDYPMLVEMEVNQNECDRFVKCEDWGYIVNHTLYLTPVTSRFIFFSSEHENITISKAKINPEVKSLALYVKRFDVKTFPKMQRQIEVEDVETVNTEALKSDFHLNKMKGFMYGYIIGRIRSLSKDDVDDLQCFYDLGKRSASRISGLSEEENDELLRWKKLHASAMEWIVFLEMKGNKKYSVFDEKGVPEIKTDGVKLQNINCHVSNIAEYKMLVNDVFLSEKYNGKIDVSKCDLAKDVREKTKSLYGNEWENSGIQTYLDAMCNYVVGEMFTQPWADGVLSSITAVIMKGGNWEGLFRFMVSKGMCDYRYAFGLYGALNGFANLTRDFTDILFASENKQYTWNVYKEIHRQLTGVELSTMVLEEHIPLSSAIVESQINKSEAEEYNDTICTDCISWLKERGISFTSKAKLEALKNACIEAHGDRVKLLHILIERKLSKTKCEKILRELEPSNDGSRKVIKRKRTKSVEQSLFDAMNELQAENNRAESFDYDHIEGISHSIRSAFPNCWNIINCLKGDLEWVLNPKYCKCQTVEERIDEFCKHLEKGKTKSQSEKGTDMSWKNNVYKDVDIKAVHDFLIDKYCK